MNMQRILAAVAVVAALGTGVVIGTYYQPEQAHAQISNPEGIRFVNEVVRPLAEKYRALNISSEAALIRWFRGLNTTIPNTADTVDDGRAPAGVSRLIGTDIHSFMAQVSAFTDQMDGPGVSEVIAKPTIRQIPKVD